MIKKMKYYFAKNVFLAVVLIVIFTIVACLMWKYTLQSATVAVPTINYMNELYVHETDYVNNMSEDNQFEYTPLGTIYHAPAGVDAGPFKYLYTDEFYFSWETVARYIGDNGKYGYLNKDGSLLTEPIL